MKWYTVGLIARGGDEKHHLLKLVWKYGGQKGGRSDMPAEGDWYWETFSNETFNQLFPTWPSTRRMPLRDCLFCLKTLTLRSGIITLILLFFGSLQRVECWLINLYNNKWEGTLLQSQRKDGNMKETVEVREFSVFYISNGASCRDTFFLVNRIFKYSYVKICLFIVCKIPFSWFEFLSF